MDMTVADAIEKLAADTKERGFTRFSFEFRVLPEDAQNPIELLDLSTRSHNALKSAGIFTIKDLADRVTNLNSLNGIDRLGAKSKREVMTTLLALHIFRNVEADRPLYDGITMC